MATHSPSFSTVSQGSTTQPQADPLPTKRGEIGYRESLNPSAPSSTESESDITAHQTSIPADGESQPACSEPGPSPITNADGNQFPAESQPSSGLRFPLFKPGFTKYGVRVSTILLLVTQGAFLLITIALWVTIAKLVLPSSDVGKQIGTSVFVHITFILCAIIQVVLLERIFFRYRAERYAMLHPGEILPDVFNRGEQISIRLALAPWNRPPLPTYAAVLMESGVGTGDVEDNRIAVAPPPAYGNTRGSTLILAGFISSELREQSRPTREARGERSSLATVASVESNKTSNKSRPVSYMTVDSEWDARCDMSRATYLAETLARLETEERDLTAVRVVSPAPTQAGFVNPAS
ncbi:hypothetical protein BDM02DRAFT_3185856 [Thelephora ganbajun]|uniref:Uncharacterized protein n=1 Tax=Thelephora ganbajun TaxID=370292 RepID=A0ACB6ZJX1_THEGA|nr:hypothetical protein BDM02DRAFT_3185856 [Thelephora ganbajun]